MLFILLSLSSSYVVNSNLTVILAKKRRMKINIGVRAGVTRERERDETREAAADSLSSKRKFGQSQFLQTF